MLTPTYLATIRARAKADNWNYMHTRDRQALLDHIDALTAAIEAVRSVVTNDEGEYLDGSDFDGLAGEVQRMLREHGAIEETLPEPRDVPSA